MKKARIAISFAILFTVIAGQTVMAEWKSDEKGSHYYYDNGKLAKNTYVDGKFIWSDGTVLGEDNSNWKERYYVSCNEFITLRQSPKTSGAEICKIPRGQKIEALEQAENDFIKVSYHEKQGYVLGKYLSSKEEQPKEEKQMTVVKCNESITLRVLPKTSGQEILQMKKGETKNKRMDFYESLMIKKKRMGRKLILDGR